MNNILKSISPETTGVLIDSFNFFWISLLVVSLIALAIILVYVFKGKIWSLFTGLISGLILMLVFAIVINEVTITNEAIDKTKYWLSLPGSIFIDLVTMAIPLYLPLVVSSLVFSEHFGNINKKTYLVSFASLLGLSVFGILVALLMSPLIALIPNELWTNWTNGAVGSEEEGGIWWLWILFLVLIVTSFLISLITRLILKDKSNKIGNVINIILKYITLYFKIVVTAVPVIVLTQFASIGMSENVGDNVILMLMYMSIFWLGALIIFGSLFAFNILLSDSESSNKEKATVLVDQTLTVFAHQNTQSSLPTTQVNAQKLGVCEEISKLTPTKGIFMGMVMCNGYAPMIVMMFILASAGMFAIGNVLLVALLIFSLSISTSGAGSADYFIITTSLNVFGLGSGTLGTQFYLSVIMPAQEINERTITRPNNTLGHMAATQLTEKHHKKMNECDCDSKKVEN